MRQKHPTGPELRARTEDFKEWGTIMRVAEAIAAGRLTPIDVLEDCLTRIDRYEPFVHAWAYLDRDGARQQAERLTADLRERGFPRGPLHGIPIGIKDIIDVFDMPTACGSKLWANSIARKDAACVANLRHAGAIILGKTVTTAYAYLDPPATRNPWHLDHTPGGSSSGSAAAVAYGGCMAALGSQTGGSITRPASFCGVCSLKPSWRRVSVEGVLPLAPSLDHVGVMARSVRDLGILFQASGSHHENLLGPTRIISDVARLKLPHREPIRFGWLGGPFFDLLDAETQQQLSLTRDLLTQSGGVEIMDIALPAGFAEVWPKHRALMAAEAAHVHRERYRVHPDDYPPKIAELIEDGLRLSGADVIDALRHREELVKQITPIFEELAVLLCPGAPGPAPGPETTGNPVFNSPWSYLRLPAVSFPIWQVGPHNLPIAVQLVGQNLGERKLLGVARWCEEQINWLMGWPLEFEE